MLEKGIHHVTQDSRMPYGFSFATYAQQLFSKLKSKKKDSSNTFTLRQAFFVVAGGLAVETKSFHKEQYLTITPAGAVELARLGLLTPVSEDVIDDKTKADLITKLLVCMQAGWFIIQCIARVAQHLPLSLLEIHVLTHVFVALLMYLFWFAKPYDALSPVVVTEPRVVEAVALFTLAQRDERADETEMTDQATERCVLKDGPPTTSHVTIGRTLSSAMKEKKLSNDGPILRHEKDVGQMSASNGEGDDGHSPSDLAEHASMDCQSIPANGTDDISKSTARFKKHHRNVSSSSITLPSSHHGQSNGHESGCSVPVMQERQLSYDTHLHIQSEAAPKPSTISASGEGSQLDEHSNSNFPAITDRQGHHASTAPELAQLAVQRLKSLNIHLTYFMIDEIDIQYFSTYVVHAIHDFASTPSFNLSRAIFSSGTPGFDAVPENPIYLLALICFVPYGALHLSAWNAHFPTLVERSLWRAAGLSIVGGPMLMECCARLYLLLVWVLDLTKSGYLPSELDCLIIMLILLSGVCAVLFYPIMAASRIYFLVEAFASLRDPAPRTYGIVKWTQFWPHF